VTGTHLIDGFVRAAGDRRVVYLRPDGAWIAAGRLGPGGEVAFLSEAGLPAGHFVSDAVIAGDYAYLVTAASHYVAETYVQDNTLQALPLAPRP
jgi:hypothetical protein